MKRLGLIVVVLLMGVVFYRPATSQDNQEERILALETRVSVLERMVGAGSANANSPGAEAETYSIYGIVHFHGQSRTQISVTGSKCAGVGIYSDFLRGTRFEVHDAGGALLGAGELQTGDLENAIDEDALLAYASCLMPFEVRDLPRADTYILTIPDAPSREWIFSFDQMEESDWSIRLEII